MGTHVFTPYTILDFKCSPSAVWEKWYEQTELCEIRDEDEMKRRRRKKKQVAVVWKMQCVKCQCNLNRFAKKGKTFAIFVWIAFCEVNDRDGFSSFAMFQWRAETTTRNVHQLFHSMIRSDAGVFHYRSFGRAFIARARALTRSIYPRSHSSSALLRKNLLQTIHSHCH